MTIDIVNLARHFETRFLYKYDMTGTWADNEKELEARLSEILHYIWDPIGVAGNPHARDEYDGYVGALWGVVSKKEGDAEEIASILCEFASSSMGLQPDRERTKEAAEAIVSWRKNIYSVKSE